MKMLSVILAFLVLGLSCLPCDDNASIAQIGNLTIELANHQNSQDHKDACSPFCHCTCCASFLLNHTQPLPSTRNDSRPASFSCYLPAHLIEVSLPVWQPPQLS